MYKKIVIAEVILIAICAVIIALLLGSMKGSGNTAAVSGVQQTEAAEIKETENVDGAETEETVEVKPEAADAAQAESMPEEPEDSRSGAEKAFSGKKFSVLGESFSSPTSPTGNPADSEPDKFVWWQVVAEHYDMQLLRDCSHGGSGIYIDSPWYGQPDNGMVAYKQLKTTENPEVIFSMLGIADLYAGISYEDILAGERELAASVKDEYSDAIVVICSYPVVAPKDKWDMVYEKYAALSKIKERVAKEYGLIFVDMFELFCDRAASEEYLREDDDKHPSFPAERLMGELAIEKIEEHFNGRTD